MSKQITNYAFELDLKTEEQFKRCYSQDFVLKASLMPDAHSGYVAPIGSVFVTKEFIVPSWIGFDIGCGVSCLNLKREISTTDSKKNKDKFYESFLLNKEKIFYEIKKRIPMGLGKLNHIQNISKTTKEKFKVLLDNLKTQEIDKELFKYIKNNALSNLGTLGSGNHFIEFGLGESGLNFIIHSGSRNIGHKIAETYMRKAALENDINEKILEKKTAIEDLFPIKANSKLGQEYLAVTYFASKFAKLNRDEIALQIENVLKSLFKDLNFTLEKRVENQHNFIEEENNLFIHRKGVISAKKGELGIIPGDMYHGSFIVVGLGNKDFLESVSHGAGRTLSRTAAKKKIKLEDYQKYMENIVGDFNEKNINESPFAYKNINIILRKQKQSIKIIEHISPLINFKG